jgi:hypothetical protein
MRPPKLPGIIRYKEHITILAGRKGSGKTHLCLQLLRSERAWKGVYDEIIIISPTFLLQPIWTSISSTGITVHLGFTEQIISDLMIKQEKNQQRVLLILDDLGEDVHHCKEAKATFHKLIANSRHLHISIVWLCQKLTQSPTFFRANTDVFVSFASLSTRETECLYNEISICDKKRFHQMFRDCTESQYSFFAATFQNGKLEYFKNLKHKINVND